MYTMRVHTSELLQEEKMKRQIAYVVQMADVAVG